MASPQSMEARVEVNGARIAASQKAAIVLFGVVLGSLSGLVVLSIYLGPVRPPLETDTAVSWVKSYGSLRELIEDSDLVVLGEVIGTFVQINTYGPWASEYVHTVYKFRVERIIISKVEVGEVLTLNHTGAIVDGQPRQIIKEDPPLSLGERLVLFLARAKRSDTEYLEPTQYFILGPWGRFIISSDKVFSLGALYPASKGCSLDIDGVDLEWFLQEILSSADH